MCNSKFLSRCSYISENFYPASLPNLIRNSSCHNHFVVENEMDTSRHPEDFQWAISCRYSRIFSLMLDWRVYCTRLKISACIRASKLTYANKKSSCYFDIRSISHAMFVLFIYVARKCHARWRIHFKHSQLYYFFGLCICYNAIRILKAIFLL